MRGLVFACFFLSGASGLIFELCWTRGLTLVFGSTTLAISTVLSTFMGGLGLGSFLAGRYAHRVRDPIRAYALAEIAIGVFALLIPLVLGLYPGLNRWLWGTVGDRYTLLSILRFAAAALLLLGPTTLMGATLPLLARAIVSRPAELPGIGRHLGRLYATNLFGAVAGSFLAGFIFLPAFGVSTTNAIAASFNFALAAAILALGRVVSRRPAPVAPPLDSIAEPVASPPLSLPASAQAIVLTGFLLSGASAMTLQVLWTRALAVVIGSSVFSFTLILVGFLIGLGLGAHLFGRLADRLRRPVAALATLHLGIATAVGLSHLVMDRLPYFFAWLLGATRASVDTIQACQFAAVCASILPATI